jgi:hypothetical protein
MNQSESIKELAEALAKAQGQIEGAKKDTKGHNYKYADLASVWEVCREPLSQNGLSVAQFPEGGPDQVTVVTRLFHSSGQWLESSLTLRPTKPDAQGIGSAITYARRYSLMAVAGIAPEDDDGQEASKPTSLSQSPPDTPFAGPSVASLKSEIRKLVQGKPVDQVRQSLGFVWTECDDPHLLANALDVLKAS